MQQNPPLNPIEVYPVARAHPVFVEKTVGAVAALALTITPLLQQVILYTAYNGSHPALRP